MTRSTIAFTSLKSAMEAGTFLGKEILEGLGGRKPSAVILFASSEFQYEILLKAINDSCSPEILVGCSSAGEFTSSNFDVDSVSAVGIYSTDIKFSAGVGTGIMEDRNKVVNELLPALTGINTFEYPFQSALILADALSGHSDEIIDILTEKTGTYQFFGGGAGDNANFKKTHVFLGEEAHTDAAVILEMLSMKPIGLGVKHGWVPTGEKMRVTESSGMQLISLNGLPAVEVFKEYAERTKHILDIENPIPFFLHNILGIETPIGSKLRVPLTFLADGSVICASNVPTGAIVTFMTIEPDAAKKAAKEASSMAIENLNGNKPSVALFFDCVATRLRMGNEFKEELKQVKESLRGINMVGCNTYGQIARVNGQFSGFHNCTAVICVIPE